MTDSGKQFTLNEICVLADMPVRTLRYYVQQGMVDRPDGETRAARYSGRHLEQVLLIKKWTTAGLSLERIKEVMQGTESAVPVKSRKPGSIEVCSHLHIADGLEMVIEPSRSGMSPEQLRQLVRQVMALYAAMVSSKGQQEGSIK